MNVLAVAEYPEMSAETREKSPQPQVLVVDDEPLIRWSLNEVLADAGCLVKEAADGASAVDLLTRARFDVVLLDYRLPDSNDLHLLETIRRLSPLSTVIMMTAFGAPDVVDGALRLGVFRVVPKPFDVNDMARLVAEAPGLPRDIA
jgi:DNA-binding NtrC family response regulator